jgi:hypothetical protein
VTLWATGLLAAFAVLGLSGLGARDSMRAAVTLAALVLLVMRFAVW